MPANDVSLSKPSRAFRFVPVTEGADLLDWATLDALYEERGSQVRACGCWCRPTGL